MRALSNSYSRDALHDVLELAKSAVEKEYGIVFLSEPIYERLLEQCREIVKSYNSEVAFEEMKREIIDLVRRR
ncbi:MAG: hypothetical protein QMD21_07040 [Candidatus Thermoplasmatota archaeon]|nr:hypothetical protein [Candidatus Thermoplasmatota archaeon]MDI6856515.1 hypothetical protein [Candidatus Thermoplasmatota archaeon]